MTAWVLLGSGPRTSCERVYSGGTTLVYEWDLPRWIQNLATYIQSQHHLAAKAKETSATVVLSNHSEGDEAWKKNRMLAGRGDGPHAYEDRG